MSCRPQAVNRYKLAVGTRFFRVRVRPWDRQSAMRREQERRQILKGMTAAAQGGGTAGPAGAAVPQQIAAMTGLPASPAAAAPAHPNPVAAATASGIGGPADVPNLPVGAASPVTSPATSI